uniref:UvrD-like helicase ATP-binding domain-containing protein n=1 Tax=Cupriavidus pinatubonensis (strain JMP 134 / LMG 1197) TaxID=264198 RepID=Q46N05_CUPPJ
MPFLLFKFPGKRVLGFSFEGRPHRHATGLSRFLDVHGAAYACELGRLSSELVGASEGALLKRLESLYDEILIDEVQDLSAHDWEIVDALLHSSIHIRMVGDIRQSVLATNPRSTKNKQYAYAETVKWFREREQLGRLAIRESVETWRCHPKIAAFSDTIFDASWAFPSTVSRNDAMTDHDGVFLLTKKHVRDYVERFAPQCLRSMAGSGKEFNLDFMNFKVAKGSTFERVLIMPTAGITDFVRKGSSLEPVPAASFYVAVTRAAQSVAMVIDNAGASTLPYWTP